MSKIKLVTKQRKADKDHNQLLAPLLLLIAGVYGIAQFFQLIEGVAYSGWAVYLLSAVLCSVLWYFWFFRRKQFPLLIVAVLGILFLAVFLKWDILKVQFSQVMNGISGETDLEIMSVTELVLVLAAGLSMSLFVFEIILQSHAAFYLVTSALLLLSPLLGIRPGIGTIVLLAFFQITFWALHLSGKGRGNQSLKGRGIRITVVVLAACLLFSIPLVSHYAQELFELAYEAEGYVYRMANRLSGRAGDPITGGRVNGGNHYRTGTGHLELTVSEPPSETLYLRGFSGGEYIGGGWMPSSDDVLLSDMAEKLDWQRWESLVSSMYYNMYFVMNTGMLSYDVQGALSLTIRHLNGEYGNDYVPYYSRKDRGPNNYRVYGTDMDGYTYQYFEQSDMDVEWNDVSEDFELVRDWYMQVRDAYMEEIQTAYTQVPTELLPRLTKLAEDNPMDDLNELSAFILYTLHSNASYTLTPGWTPFNEDIAEYFLFESGRGYCEHFALAATILYRLYGIPARYATGYMVPPSDFEQQEDGTYRAVATDEHAHAWVEIFLEDYGWTPVEVTPASDGSTVADYPGFDGVELSRILSARNWNRNVPSLTENGDSLGNAADTQDWDPQWEIDFEQRERLFWVLGTCFLYSLVLVPLFLDYRRLRCLKKMGSMNCRRIFSRYMQMLHFFGYFQNYDGSEEEFILEFAAEVPVVSMEEILQMQNIVCEAAYGFGDTTIEKEEFVRNIYFRTGNFIYGKLGWRQKLIFRYWKAFG